MLPPAFVTEAGTANPPIRTKSGYHPKEACPHHCGRFFQFYVCCLYQTLEEKTFKKTTLRVGSSRFSLTRNRRALTWAGGTAQWFILDSSRGGGLKARHRTVDA